MLLVSKKFTVKKYQEMIESGMFTSDDHIELIRGEIIEMSPIGRKHANSVKRLNAILSQKLSDQVIVSVQDPVELDDNSAPQPDVALLKKRDDFYLNSGPNPRDIFLIIEVADTTIKSDRDIKIPLYAEVNINEVWLVDTNNQLIEVYRQPFNGVYRQKQTFFLGDNISILAFPDVNIAVNDVF